MLFAKKKTFWDQYGKWLLALVVIAALSYGSLQYYQHTVTETSIRASMLYDQMILGSMSGDEQSDAAKQGVSSAKILLEEYKETPYASMAALFLAKQSYEQKNTEEARRYLELAIKDNDRSPVRPVATVRLAKLLGQEKKFKEALDLLTVIQPEGYESLFEETKGDIYWMQGDKDKARLAYQGALKLNPKGIPTSRLEIKLAEMGLAGGL